MAVILHANVGLMHGAMAIYNAWCDRVPMVILGATGPSRYRRATALDRLAAHGGGPGRADPPLCGNGDDQPASVAAGDPSLVRAAKAWPRSVPRAPTYVCLDVAMREQAADRDAAAARPKRFAVASPAVPEWRGHFKKIASLLRNAGHPLLLFGRMSRPARRGSTGRPGRASRRIGPHRHQDGRGLPDRPSPASSKPGFSLDEERRRCDPRGRRRPGIRLGRSRRHSPATPVGRSPGRHQHLTGPPPA